MSFQSTNPPTLEPLNIDAAVLPQGGHQRSKIARKLSGLLTMRNLVVFSVTAAFVGVMWGFVFYFSHLVFTKPQQVTKGSLGYSLFISKFVKQIPVFKPLENSEKFYFNIISNASTPVNIIRYESHAPSEEIVSYYRLYFELVNYAFVRNEFDDHTMAIFRNTHEEYAVFVTTGENVNTVSIENTKNINNEFK
jgi:hypothetical protein